MDNSIQYNMMQSLKIRNFKNLSGLNIPKLSRINLISGKNNVGKSSLLEAIGVYVDDSELFYIIEERGELPKQKYKVLEIWLEHISEPLDYGKKSSTGLTP